jgi:hypothetical protein
VKLFNVQAEHWRDEGDDRDGSVATVAQEQSNNTARSSILFVVIR